MVKNIPNHLIDYLKYIGFLCISPFVVVTVVAAILLKNLLTKITPYIRHWVLFILGFSLSGIFSNGAWSDLLSAS